MTDPRTISYTREEHVGWIRMGQPDAMTLMSGPLMSEIRAALQTATADPEVRVLVLIGQGRTFIAGADLRFIRDASSEEFLEFNRENQSLAAELIGFERPTIAAVNGHALGGGLEIALACDIRVCATTARLGFPEVAVALLHSTGSSYLLPRMVGLARAKELTLTGRIIDAGEAVRIGLATNAVPPDMVEQVARETALSIAEKAPVAVAWTKRIFDVGAHSDLSAALSLEAVGNRACSETEDRVEGARAFFDKRAPVYRGR